MVFNHDWWHGGGYDRQLQLAKSACTANRYPDAGTTDPASAATSPSTEFLRALETRTVIYLRDGFSYEVKRLIVSGAASFLCFECAPTEEAYRVGAFVVCVAFEEIQRVEVFAVHPTERPDETPAIKGFGGAGLPPGGRGEDRTPRPDNRDLDAAPQPETA